MKCPFCFSNTKVTDTRSKGYIIYRRRDCTSCGERFTTQELNAHNLLNLLEDYLPERLVDEISLILEKGDIGEGD